MSDEEFAKKCKAKGGRVVKDGNSRYCVINVEARHGSGRTSSAPLTAASGASASSSA